MQDNNNQKQKSIKEKKKKQKINALNFSYLQLYNQLTHMIAFTRRTWHMREPGKKEIDLKKEGLVC